MSFVNPTAEIPLPKSAISVTGIWLQGIHGSVKVLAEIAGRWVVVIHEQDVTVGPTSHIVEASGMAQCSAKEYNDRKGWASGLGACPKTDHEPY